MQGIPQGQSSQNSSGGLQKPSLSWQTPGAPNKPLLQNTGNSKPPAPVVPKMNDKKGQEKSNMTTYAGIFVVGLVVGVLLGWGVIGGRSGGETTSTATTTENTAQSANTPPGASAIGSNGSLTAGSLMETNDVVVNSPQGAGSSIAVSKVNVTKPTWVAVYDNNAGVPGNALGATLFLSTAVGGQTSGTIELLRPTVSGKTYLVGQQLDNGDYTFSRTSDSAVLDADGKPVLMTLTVN
jgi:hypothetical protein